MEALIGFVRANRKALGGALAVLGPVVGGGIFLGKIDPTDGQVGTLATAVGVMATLASTLVLGLIKAKAGGPPAPGAGAAA